MSDQYRLYWLVNLNHIDSALVLVTFRKDQNSAYCLFAGHNSGLRLFFLTNNEYYFFSPCYMCHYGVWISYFFSGFYLTRYIQITNIHIKSIIFQEKFKNCYLLKWKNLRCFYNFTEENKPYCRSQIFYKILI